MDGVVGCSFPGFYGIRELNLYFYRHSGLDFLIAIHDGDVEEPGEEDRLFLSFQHCLGGFGVEFLILLAVFRDLADGQLRALRDLRFFTVGDSDVVCVSLCVDILCSDRLRPDNAIY